MASATSISATKGRLGRALRAEWRQDAKTRRANSAWALAKSRFAGALVLGNTIALLLLVFGGLGLSAYSTGLLRAEQQIVSQQADFIRMALLADGIPVCGDGSCFDRPARAAAVTELASANFQGRVALYSWNGGKPQLLSETAASSDGEAVAVPVPSFLPQLALPSSLREAVGTPIEQLIFEAPLRDSLTTLSLSEEIDRIGSGTLEPGSRLRHQGRARMTATTTLKIVEDGEVQGLLVAEKSGIVIISEEVRSALAPIALMTFGFASFSALVLTAAITKPLRQLSHSAEQIRSCIGRAGSVELPDLDDRPDDIGRLSRSFRAMTEALVERIETIDHFAADVSHEIKNPLTSIKSAVETLDKCRTDEQRERLLKVIANDVERMDRLISDISNASRLDAQLATQQRKILSASKLVGDVVESYRTVMDIGGPRVNFWDETAGDPKIFGASASLGRVVRNLIDNAVSFSPPSGAVTVALEKFPGPGQGFVLITVTDEGPGVPKDNLETIFNRFYTSRPSGTTFGANSGLGLAIARQIIESHGGRIWCENIADDCDEDSTKTGARFSIEMPVYQGGVL